MRINFVKYLFVFIVGAGLGFGIRSVIAANLSSANMIPNTGGGADFSKISAIALGNIPLRSGPESILFPQIGASVQGDTVVIIGKARGTTWVKVEMPDSKTGWMDSSYLDFNADLSEIPVAEVPNGSLIRIKTRTTLAGPLAGIWIDICPALGGVSDCTSTRTNSQGLALAYLPTDQLLPWTAKIVASEPAIESDYFPPVSDTAAIDLTNQPTELIVFSYEPKTVNIQGKVVDGQGNPVSNAIVFAQRSDGVQSQIQASAQGEFVIRVANGNWEMSATDAPRSNKKSPPRQVIVVDEQSLTNLVLTLP